MACRPQDYIFLLVVVQNKNKQWIMIQIFTIDRGIVQPTTEVLLISPFKQIWDRDLTPKKERAMREFSYIFFMNDYSKNNPYIGYQPMDRHKKICESVLKDRAFIPDDTVKEACRLYRDYQENASPSLTFYRSVIKGVQKVITFIETVDLGAEDARGVPKYKPNDIMSVTKNAPEQLKALVTMKEKVEQEFQFHLFDRPPFQAICRLQRLAPSE